MGRSQETFSKKEKEKKRLKKRQDKLLKKEERSKSSNKGGGLDSMIAYVDEYGRITDTPPDPAQRRKVDASSIEIGVPKREEIDMTVPRHGKVEFFNDSKGFGFIKDRESGEQFFVHVHGLIDKITENDEVIFELEPGMKGLNAVQVKKA